MPSKIKHLLLSDDETEMRTKNKNENENYMLKSESIVESTKYVYQLRIVYKHKN